ncbi:MAG TPA: GatB/YqeY domain-containing protein [Longimicrobium sp.]|jgi:hypothetical protein
MPDVPLKDQVRTDLNDARRGRDKLRTTVLSTFISEIRNREIEVGGELNDEQVQGVAITAIKKRREAAELMRANARAELAEKEEQEAAVLQAYLPAQLTEDEVRAMVREAVAAGAKNLGDVMKQVSPRTKGRFEGKELNRVAKEVLAG